MFGNLFFKKTVEIQPIQNRKLDDFDLHLKLTFQIEEAYRKRNLGSGAIQETIDLCLMQINMAKRAKSAWIKEDERIGIFEFRLPTHKGYTQLCIILEKEKKFEEVIKLANEAKEEGWAGDWDKRILRCQSKILSNKF